MFNFLILNQMCEVLNYLPTKFPFLTTDKIYAVLNDVKYAVMKSKCAVLNEALATIQRKSSPIFTNSFYVVFFR